MKKKEGKLFCGYLSQEVFDIIQFLVEREEITKVVFVRRAIRCFLAGDHTIMPRLRITKRSDPEYIPRHSLFSVKIDAEQREQLEQIAEEQQASLSQVFFAVMVNYCAVLISMDDTGISMIGADEL